MNSQRITKVITIHPEGTTHLMVIHHSCWDIYQEIYNINLIYVQSRRKISWLWKSLISLGSRNVCEKTCGKPSNSCHNSSGWTKAVNRPNTLHNNTIIQCSFKLISFELVLTLQLICFPFLLKDVYVTLNTSQTAQTHQMKISHGKQIVSTPRPQTDS